MITPLIDLVKLDYNRIPNQDTLNPGIELVTEINKPIYIKNTVELFENSIIYKVGLDKPSKEVFLADYGQLLIEDELKDNFFILPVTFFKEDFHLKDLKENSIRENLNLKNCHLINCPLSFEKLLKEGYTLEDYNIKHDVLNKELLIISKILFMDDLDGQNIYKQKIINGIPLNYENEIKGFMKYKEFLLRNNKNFTNNFEIFHDFYKMKKENINKIQNYENTKNIPSLNKDFTTEFNYLIVAYEKFLVKINHLIIIYENTENKISESIINLKKKYILGME